MILFKLCSRNINCFHVYGSVIVNIPALHFVRSHFSMTNAMVSFAAVLSDRLILLSFLEQSQVAAVYLGQKNQRSPERRTDKLFPSEVKVEWSGTPMASSWTCCSVLVRRRSRTRQIRPSPIWGSHIYFNQAEKRFKLWIIQSHLYIFNSSFLNLQTSRRVSLSTI